MFNARFTALVLCAFAFSDVALGRYQWLERDGRHVALYPRRFSQEHPPVIDKLAQACGNGICATLAGAAITPLLAAQPECSQQDMADKIIGMYYFMQINDVDLINLLPLNRHCTTIRRYHQSKHDCFGEGIPTSREEHTSCK